MKTKLLLLLVALPSMISCKLDETIYDTPAPSNFLRNAADLNNLIGGMYGHFAEANLFKERIFTMAEAPTDYMLTLSPANKLAMGNRSFNASQVELLRVWRGFYKIIGNANELLKVVDQIELSESDYNQAKGQACFLRAFCYFYMVRFFGGVPVFSEPTSASTDFYKDRNTVDEVYQLIFSDLKDASERLLPQSTHPDAIRGRATKGAADAFQALAHLTYGNYLDHQGKDANEAFTNARDYANKVIISNEYRLKNNFGDLWDVSKEAAAYEEVIFGISYTIDPIVSAKPSRGSEYAHVFNPSTTINVSGNAPDGQGFGHFKVQAWFYDFCTKGQYAGDYRSEKSFTTSFTWRTNPSLQRVTYPEIPSGGGQENMPYLKKYISPGGFTNNDENDLFLMRLAEVYLIFAEAENELNGPTSAAYGAFNHLRERARKANGTPRTTPVNLPVGLSKADFRMSVFHERGVELIGEGHRWFDLVRMKAPSGKSMYEFMHNEFVPQNYTAGVPTYNATTRRWSAGRYDTRFVPPFEERYLLNPIPADEMAMNPIMKPNPGW